jgi:hypothetical protein
MSVISQNYYSFKDLALAMGKDMSAADVINMASRNKPILEDALALPCNDGTKHKTLIKKGLPTYVLKALYGGVPASRGNKMQVEDTCSVIASAAEIEVDYIDIFEKAEDKKSARLEEASDHVEALGQGVETLVIYGNSATNPRAPRGLVQRYSSLTAENGKNIIHGAGTIAGGDSGKCTSVWFITWDSSTVHLIYPKGANAGVKQEDNGKINKEGPEGTYFVYRDDFSWHVGVSLRDWRYVVRIAGINAEDLLAFVNAQKTFKYYASAGNSVVANANVADGSGADVESLLISTADNIVGLFKLAYYQHEGRNQQKGKTFIYANTLVVASLDFMVDLGMPGFSKSEIENGGEVLKFRGIKIRECAAILNTEDPLQ